MPERSAEPDLLPLDSPRVLADAALDGVAPIRYVDASAPLELPEAGVVRFVVAPEAAITGLAAGVWLAGEVELSIPSADVDDTSAFDLRLCIFPARRQRIIVSIERPGAVPRSLVKGLIETVGERIATERSSESFDPEAAVAKGAASYVLAVLRTRVRRIEDSVRAALSAETPSPADYELIREYPMRLAMVERMVADLPIPRLRARGHGWGGGYNEDGFADSLAAVDRDAREAMARLSGLIASWQLVVSHQQAAEAGRFQRLLTLVGATVLVPGLVAAAFGANVDFPGRDQVSGLWAMLLLMIGAGAGSYALLRSIERDLWPGWLRRLGSENARLGGLVLVALAAFAGAALVLACA